MGVGVYLCLCLLNVFHSGQQNIGFNSQLLPLLLIYLLNGLFNVRIYKVKRGFIRKYCHGE